MASANRFSVLQVDDEPSSDEKGTAPAARKSKQGKGNAKPETKSSSGTSSKKRNRRKKSGGAMGDGSQQTEQQKWEDEQRQETLDDHTYEEEMKEAILNSKITFEEEQDARKRNPHPMEEPVGRQKGKKKAGSKGKKHGITLSLAELQTAEFTNGGVVVAPPPAPPSPPALPTRNGNRTETDIFAASEREAHRLLEAEKRKEILEKSLRNFSLQPTEPELRLQEVEEDVEEDEPLDAETLRLLLEDREKEIADLNAKIKTLETEREELRHYFRISENKTAAELGAEVEKLSRLNRELNNNLVDTCIKLEQERSRAHELEKSLTASGRTARTSHRTSESDW